MLPDNLSVIMFVITEIGPKKSQYHQIICSEHVLTQSMNSFKMGLNLRSWE